MKLNLEIDCTPDEARTFFGLPDVKPMQATIMAHMEKRMIEVADSFTPDGILRAWFSLVPDSQQQLRSWMQAFLPRAPGGPPGSAPGGKTGQG